MFSKQNGELASMKCARLLVAAVLITGVKLSFEINIDRFKRANTENFNVLLNIYKMNPLRESNIFKAFSNRRLLPRPDGLNPDMNDNINESIGEEPKKSKVTSTRIKENHFTMPSTTVAVRDQLRACLNERNKVKNIEQDVLEDIFPIESDISSQIYAFNYRITAKTPVTELSAYEKPLRRKPQSRFDEVFSVVTNYDMNKFKSAEVLMT